MTKITLRKNHSKTAEEIDVLVESLQSELSSQYGLSAERKGDLIEFTGNGVSGRLTLQDRQVALELELGLMMSLLAKQIEPALEQKLDKYLA